jgi:hypothetical protein
MGSAFWRPRPYVRKHDIVRTNGLSDRTYWIPKLHCQHTGKSKAVPLHAMEALRGIEDIVPTHSRPWH